MYKLNSKQYNPGVKIYKVRKFFLFKGKPFNTGKDFVPSEVQASERRVRLLFNKNLIYVLPENLPQSREEKRKAFYPKEGVVIPVNSSHKNHQSTTQAVSPVKTGGKK